MPTQPWEVHKFGGTSLADTKAFQSVAQIVNQNIKGVRRAIVVSAMSEVTNQLIAILELAKKQESEALKALELIREKHFRAIKDLLKPAEQKTLTEIISSDIKDIGDVLKSVRLSKTVTETTIELVSGYGELWSAQILAKFLGCQWLDARNVLKISNSDLGPIIHWDESEQSLAPFLKDNKDTCLVITGYVASTLEGVPTTLKRNGSDYSASIFANLLNASALTIWKDVSGVMSADPKRVPDAFLVNELSYNEAMELAFFGAKVIHPQTMVPAIKKSIPIFIRNTFHPEHPGTRIDAKAPAPEGQSVRGFSTMDKVVLLNVEGSGMIGVPGTAQRVFGALREVGVSVVMISQASSEHSICLVVPETQGSLAQKTIRQEFRRELDAGQLQDVSIVPNCTVLAAVGDAMASRPGVAARFFSSLAKAGVNVKAIAQGSSERNISAVIDLSESNRALRAVHSGFYLSPQTLSVGIIGLGLIGKTFLNQLSQRLEILKKEFKIDVRIRGLMTSKAMLLADNIPISDWEKSFSKGQAPDVKAFTEHIGTPFLPHSLIIDCTASQEIANMYPDFLKKNIHLITPNKKAGSGPLAEYRKIRELSRQLNSHILYETTVGAGLPVISTLRDLVQTGDKITRIEGILSGTLSHIFNNFNGQTPFSEIVRDAKERGFTEPDPRDDLSGMDVARKLVILAREAGLSLELKDIQVENLVDNELQKITSIDEFLKKLSQQDQKMKERFEKADRQGEVLRYMGLVEPGKTPTVALQAIKKTHPFARLTGSDNIVAFTTHRYVHQPLIVQGPGAGPEVTAAGVFADLLRLANYLGAPT